jgi:hypothetical protein
MGGQQRRATVNINTVHGHLSPMLPLCHLVKVTGCSTTASTKVKEPNPDPNQAIRYPDTLQAHLNFTHTLLDPKLQGACWSTPGSSGDQ